MDKYYDQAYFNYQREQGQFAAKAMFQFFQPYIKSSDALLDFGCGGGFLLNELKANDKIGIEINPAARKYAEDELDIATVTGITDVKDNWADIIISSHALEHTHAPLNILLELKPKLKEGGLIVFIVPHETKYKYHPDDINMHLYTWSEMNLGNLFKQAGYKVLESRELIYRFPPHHKRILHLFGWKIFHLSCRIYGHWARYRHMTQVRIIAEKI